MTTKGKRPPRSPGGAPPSKGRSTPNPELGKTNLEHGELEKGELGRADLRSARLSSANLREADLVGANLNRAVAKHAALTQSLLDRATLEGAVLSGADLKGASLRGANLTGAELVGCPMTEADLTEATLDGADLRGAVLSEARLSGASLLRARFDRAILQGADLTEASLPGACLELADATRANFDGADLRESRLDGAILAGANLRGANLEGASLHKADLRGARYDRSTRFPENFDFQGLGLVYSSEETLDVILTAMRPGHPYPLGTTWDGTGVNFAVSAPGATHVELCLFDSPTAAVGTVRIRMPEQTDGIWHIYIPNIAPGQLYGYRVHGPYHPERGQRFNPNKLLLDPYAKAISGEIAWDDALFGYRVGDPDGDLSFDERNSAGFMPKAVVVDTTFPWNDDRPPRTPLHRSVIYELHVKGFTKLHPGIPDGIRGTYVALGSQPIISYLKELGVTAVELLPVHEHVDDRFLEERGLTNYWGYNTLGFFAPNTRYKADPTPGSEVREFKAMVKALHAAGIEVILDVVYNHTAEGNQLGPTLCFRGFDNQGYYRTVAEQPRYYMDYTGCGNTFNPLDARSLQLIMDSLRYWVTEMHVDGFRFDLAAALMRGFHEADRLSAFFDVISQDPILSRVKLIAEPWDVGPGGYQVGNFPPLWSEWNGKYRDAVRRFWRGDEAQVGELAYRISGSSDLYQYSGRRPYASINFVTSHDGFTMADLVSFNDKHNEDNRDNNTDGDNHNNSWNCGVEGSTSDLEIIKLRGQQMRNLMATLLLSQGVPMILAGDERGRSQRGNNNTYCQDNELSWLDWSLDDERKRMLEFTTRLLAFRRKHPSLSRRRFFFGRRVHGGDLRDIAWLQPNGKEMTDQEWNVGYVRCLGLLLNGSAMREWSEDGSWLTDDPLLLLLNAHYEPIEFVLPAAPGSAAWHLELETADRSTDEESIRMPGTRYGLSGRSLALFVATSRASASPGSGRGKS